MRCEHNCGSYVVFVPPATQRTSASFFFVRTHFQIFRSTRMAALKAVLELLPTSIFVKVKKKQKQKNNCSKITMQVGHPHLSMDQVHELNYSDHQTLILQILKGKRAVFRKLQNVGCTSVL